MTTVAISRGGNFIPSHNPAEAISGNAIFMRFKDPFLTQTDAVSFLDYVLKFPS